MAYEWDFDHALSLMKVGDSFFVPCLNVDDTRRKIMTAARKLGVRVNIRFAVENELQGLRTWRVRVE